MFLITNVSRGKKAPATPTVRDVTSSSTFLVPCKWNLHLYSVLEIVLETARRLHFGHGMSIEEIDATGILPRLRTTSEGWGAIWHGRMRCGRFDGARTPADPAKRPYPVAGVV